MPTIRMSTMTDPFTGLTVTTESPDFSVEIRRGMDFLDAQDPTWTEKINPALLDLASTEACVCGQVFSGHYEEGVRKLAADGHFAEWGEDSIYFIGAAEFGFNIPASDALDDVDQSAIPEQNLQAYARAARELTDWAEGYIKQSTPDAEPDHEDRMQLLWSALTEQWLAAVAARRGPVTV